MFLLLPSSVCCLPARERSRGAEAAVFFAGEVALEVHGGNNGIGSGLVLCQKD